MIPFLLRIGPLAITQCIFITIGVVTLISEQIWPCYGYTLLHLALQLFLLQMIFVLRFIKHRKNLRAHYVGLLVFGSKANLFMRMIWNGVTIGGVILSMFYWMIKQGLTLSNQSIASKIYTLYPLCYFADLANHPQSGTDFGMVIDFLYACNVFMNLLLISIVFRESCLYTYQIKKNRTLLQIHKIQSSQSLLDCTVINEEYLKSGDPLKDQALILECLICLQKLNGNKILVLRCSHIFHQQCINLWLKVNDSCPYRCS